MKKGFTLIELLAILAILAIIALVTTPIVLNIINDVRKDSFEQRQVQKKNRPEMGSIQSGLSEDMFIKGMLHKAHGPRAALV